MSADRIAKLKNVGFCFDARQGRARTNYVSHGQQPTGSQSSKPQSCEEVWNNMFDGLLAYKAEHGTFPSTTQHEVYHNGKDLCRWVSYQRTGYKNAREGKPGALSADRIAKLEKASFNFVVV
jgi:hypothetical protein